MNWSIARRRLSRASECRNRRAGAHRACPALIGTGRLSDLEG